MAENEGSVMSVLLLLHLPHYIYSTIPRKCCHSSGAPCNFLNNLELARERGKDIPYYISEIHVATFCSFVHILVLYFKI